MSILPGEKLLIKMWETLTDKGVGSLLRPGQMRREGLAATDVKRQEMLTLAQAEVDAQAIREGRKQALPGGTLKDLHAPTEVVDDPLTLHHVMERAEQAHRADILRKEVNVAKAILHAEEALEDEEQEPSDKPIDDDWLYRWRDYAGNTSNEDLQQLWGRVLAGEVKSPGLCSLRTLEFIKNVSRYEAELIESISQFVINGDLILDTTTTNQTSSSQDFRKLLEIQELGLISGVGMALASKPAMMPEGSGSVYYFGYHGKYLIITSQRQPHQLSLSGVFKVTNIGRQVFALVKAKPNLEYIKLFANKIKSQGCTVELCDIEIVSGKHTITKNNCQEL